jgi:hypothetical protein
MFKIYHNVPKTWLNVVYEEKKFTAARRGAG